MKNNSDIAMHCVPGCLYGVNCQPHLSCCKVLNVRDISEVLSELEEQEEPKEESSNGSNKFVYNHDYHDDSDVKKKGPTTVLNTDRNKPS